MTTCYRTSNPNEPVFLRRKDLRQVPRGNGGHVSAVAVTSFDRGDAYLRGTATIAVNFLARPELYVLG